MVRPVFSDNLLVCHLNFLPSNESSFISLLPHTADADMYNCMIFKQMRGCNSLILKVCLDGGESISTFSHVHCAF